jgi:hypothetical protein
MRVPAFINSFLRKINHDLKIWGLDLRRTIIRLRGIRHIRRERHEYERQRKLSGSPSDFPIVKSFTFYEDRFDTAGQYEGHYFHQDLMVAREIFKRKPVRHVDVGSSIYGFVSHVASFRNIEVVDIRPMKNSIPGIHFIQQDVMNMDNAMFESTDSISCLHALEHFGLGRYNDPLDYFGWLNGLQNITSMLKVGGFLYLGVPTGTIQRVEFNAHRVFSLPFLRKHLESHYEIVELAFVDDEGKLHRDLDPHSATAESSFQAHYGCSIWILRKLSHESTPV